MRLFAQLSWVLSSGVATLPRRSGPAYYHCHSATDPPKVVGYVVDGVTEQHYTAARVMMWVGTLVLTAVVFTCCVMSGACCCSVRPISLPLSCVRTFTAS